MKEENNPVTLVTLRLYWEKMMLILGHIYLHD